MIRYLFVFFFLIAFVQASAQIRKQKVLMKDSLDGAFDFSDFLIYTPGGFIPVPTIITEPAFGGFGIAVAPIFLKKRPPVVDTIQSKIVRIPTPPDITGAAFMYTANNSWAAIAFRSSTWMKLGIKYRIGGGYANMNLDFYRTTNGVERKYAFNFHAIPVSITLLKQFNHSKWSAGLQYMFMHTEVKATSGDLPSFVSDKEISSLQSMPGIVTEFEGRDNVFTPDKGFRFHASLGWSNPAFGSDFNYENLNVYGYYYQPFSGKVVAGFRYEMQQVFGSPPFYLLPYINLRGLPVARYQGNIFSVFETEVRWDVVMRWSIVGFVGSGKAYSAWSDFSQSSWVSSGGGGFRYLVARKFRLRMGMDLARGPEQWAYYLVFGSAWGR